MKSFGRCLFCHLGNKGARGLCIRHVARLSKFGHTSNTWLPLTYHPDFQESPIPIENSVRWQIFPTFLRQLLTAFLNTLDNPFPWQQLRAVLETWPSNLDTLQGRQCHFESHFQAKPRKQVGLFCSTHLVRLFWPIETPAFQKDIMPVAISWETKAEKNLTGIGAFLDYGINSWSGNREEFRNFLNSLFASAIKTPHLFLLFLWKFRFASTKTTSCPGSR